MAGERRLGITWSWPEAARGAVCAAPCAAIAAAADLSLGVVFALGTLPVAMLGVPADRGRRARLGLVGLAFAAAYALGCVVGEREAAAVVSLAVLAYACVMLGLQRPAAKLLAALLLPAFALGMNEPVPDGFVLAAMFVAGAAWTTLVLLAWPRPHPPAVAAPPPTPTRDPAHARRLAQAYGVLLAAAASIGLALGFLLDLDHVAWSAAAALFIMRPDPGLLASRAVGRVCATFAGVIAAGLIVRRGPSEAAVAAIAVAAVAAMVATRTSRWYVTSAGSGLVVLLLSGASSDDAFATTFAERLLETAIGAALALTFGVAIPYALRLRATEPRA